MNPCELLKKCFCVSRLPCVREDASQTAGPGTICVETAGPVPTRVKTVSDNEAARATTRLQMSRGSTTEARELFQNGVAKRSRANR